MQRNSSSSPVMTASMPFPLIYIARKIQRLHFCGLRMRAENTAYGKTENSSEWVDSLSGIGKVRSSSRISTGKLSLVFNKVDLGELINEVVDRYLPLIEKSKSTIEVKTAPEIYAHVDRLRFEQILINLITNAIKYAPGSKMIISLAELGGEIKLSSKIPAQESVAKIMQKSSSVSNESLLIPVRLVWVLDCI